MGGYTSFFDLFSIGIGPSSSHTVGPMRAAKSFVESLSRRSLLNNVSKLRVELYGSLALTGEGHGTPKAILLGLEGETPENVKVSEMAQRLDEIRLSGRLNILGKNKIGFSVMEDLRLNKTKFLPTHSNGMRFMALGKDCDLLDASEYFSIGGGFVLGPDNIKVNPVKAPDTPFNFSTAKELLAHCKPMSIEDVVIENEVALRSKEMLYERIISIWECMHSSIKAGLASSEKILPGVIRAPRRAPTMYKSLEEDRMKGILHKEDYLSAYAMAVNEENAAGSRVVTAPTNGAAGVIPATLRYYLDFLKTPSEDSSTAIRKFLLTGSAISSLYKSGASISAAEVGCQGEIGVACSMAAGGLAAVLGGSPNQIEHAAEIAMEHCLGLTCDPIAGLVQVPCIERNALGAAKALVAARLALRGDGSHLVSLDTAIKTMYHTGLDMHAKYKETSLAGLAIHHPEC